MYLHEIALTNKCITKSSLSQLYNPNDRSSHIDEVRGFIEEE